MKAIRILLFLTIIQNVSAQNTITIPDSNFLNYLKTRVPNCIQGDQLDTTCSDLNSISVIQIFQLNIKSIEGIQYFKSLTEFRSRFNPITSIDKMPSMVTRLHCDYSKITSITKLPPNLQYFVGDSNYIRKLPALPSSLIVLQCGFCGLDSLPELPNGLTSLLVGQNNLKTLAPFKPNLTQIAIGNNFLTELPDLPENLFYLLCSNNKLTSLPNLPSKLVTLNCFNNQLSHLPVLPKTIRTLDCSYNQIKCFPKFPSSLTSLCNIENNPFKYLPNIVPKMPDSTKAKPICYDGDTVNNPFACDTLGISRVVVSTNSIVFEKKITIYPNPGNGLIQVFVEEHSNSPHQSIQIYNSDGSLILNEILNEQYQTIDLSQYASGLYFIRVRQEETIQYIRYIKL